MKSTLAQWGGSLLLCGALLLGSCGGGGGPPDQDGPASRPDVTGTAVAGSVVVTERFGIEATAKGAAGLQRMSNNARGSSDYALSVSELTAPYVLSALVVNEFTYEYVYGVALAPGPANITPLTSLLVAQLFGQDPAAVFSGFGPAAGTNLTRVTPESVVIAQRQLKGFLQEELGVTVPAEAGDLITAPFRPVAGDPMFDAISAVVSKLAADGVTQQAFSDRVAAAARLCLTERIGIEIGAQTTDFCPQSKSATPRAGDETLLDYLFVDRLGNQLKIAVRGDAVLNTRYDVAGASTSFQCSGAGCSGIQLGPVAADLSRSFSFGPSTLQGASGAAVLAGTLTGAIPGVVVPVLPCDNNRFTLVLPDRSVVAKCVDPDPLGFGIGGTLNSLVGVAPSRATYRFVDTSIPDNTLPQLSVLTDANDRVISVEFTDNEPDTYTPRRRFVCKLDACNGVSLGAVTVNVDVLGPDYPVLLRTITFEGTLLAGYTADGEATGTTATLRASVVTAYLADVLLSYRAPGACAVGLSIAATASAASFNACPQPAGDAFVLPGSGDILLTAGNYETDVVQVVLRDGMVASASFALMDVPGVFICSGGCAGITVSAPDPSGARTLRFDDALLHEQFFGPVEGPRSLSLNGGVVNLAPQVPLP